jgi:hypothetical protein
MMDKNPKRPRDANQLTRHVIGIATGEIEESPSSVDKVKKHRLLSSLAAVADKRAARPAPNPFHLTN